MKFQALPVTSFEDITLDLEQLQGFLASTQPAVRATLTADWAVPSGAYAPVSWSVTEFNQGAMWTAGSPTRLTFSQDGVYVVSANVEFYASSSGTRRDIGVRKNGGGVFLAADHTTAVSAGIPVILGVSTLARFAAGDYVELLAFQDVGTTLDLRVGDEIENHFAAAWLSN